MVAGRMLAAACSIPAAVCAIMNST